MSKQEEANLILKLYELRREETMRKARDWFWSQFNPQSAQDLIDAMFGPNSAYMRMVLSYWDMAASLVNHGAIDVAFFNDANGEQIGVFAKVEPFVGAVREIYGPAFVKNLEALIDATPDGRQKTAMMRERMAQFRAAAAARQGA